MKSTVVLYSAILLCTLSAGCKSRKEPVEFPVLEEKKVSIISSRDAKRNNLIEQLWEEVKKSNAAAREYDIDLYELQKLLSDSIQELNNYLSKNREYYQLVKEYLRQVNDSVEREKLKKYFDAAEKAFNDSIQKVEQLHQTIEWQTNQLKDLNIRMKLHTTHDILQSFQQKNMPDSVSLERIRILQDSLLLYYRLVLQTDTLQGPLQPL